MTAMAGMVMGVAGQSRAGQAGAALAGAWLLVAAMAPTANAGTASLHLNTGVPSAAPAPVAGPATSSSGSMRYYGGPVVSLPKVVGVIWGGSVATTTVTNIGPFLRALVNSTYIDPLAQYNTKLTAVGGRAGTQQTISRGKVRGRYQIKPINTQTTLTDEQILAEIKAQITLGRLPAADLNSIYMVFLPPGVTVNAFGRKSCNDFYGYHAAASGTPSSSNLYYAVMPDCGKGFDALTATVSHELVETLTDPIPTPGSSPNYPQAWNTSNGSEIADLCQWRYATLTVTPTVPGQSTAKYVVQQYYSNAKAGCLTTPTYTNP